MQQKIKDYIVSLSLYCTLMERDAESPDHARALIKLAELLRNDNKFLPKALDFDR